MTSAQTAIPRLTATSTVLSQQADHVAAGGPLDRSPLAALLASRTAMPSAAGLGARESAMIITATPSPS